MGCWAVSQHGKQEARKPAGAYRRTAACSFSDHSDKNKDVLYQRQSPFKVAQVRPTITNEEKVRAGLRHAVVCQNLTGRTKETIA